MTNVSPATTRMIEFKVKAGDFIILCLVGLACFSFGVLLSLRYSGSTINAFWTNLDRGSFAFFAAIFTTNIPFLIFRQNFSLPIYVEQKEEEIWPTLMLSIGCITAAGLCFFFSNIDIYKLLFFIIYLPTIAYCYFSYRRLKKMKNIEDKDSEEYKLAKNSFYSFDNTIFFPAFIFCMTNMLWGQIFSNIFINHNNNNSINFFYSPITFVISSFIIILYYAYSKSTKQIVAQLIFPVALMLIGFFTTFALTSEWSIRELVIMCMLTYILGLAECFKHIFYTKNGNSSLKDFETASQEFYLRGVNWASIVFPLSCLFIPVIFSDISFPPIIILSLCLILFCIYAGSEFKKLHARKICLIITMGSISIFCLSIYGWGLFTNSQIQNSAYSSAKSLQISIFVLFDIIFSFFIPKTRTDQSIWFGSFFTLLTLTGSALALIRFSKDVFALKLDKFVLNIYNTEIYEKKIALLFFSLFYTIGVCVLSLLGLIFLFYWESGIIDDTNRQAIFRLTIAAVSAAMITFIAVVTCFLGTKNRQIMTGEATEINKIGEKESGHDSNQGNGGSAKQGEGQPGTTLAINLTSPGAATITPQPPQKGSSRKRNSAKRKTSVRLSNVHMSALQILRLVWLSGRWPLSVTAGLAAAVAFWPFASEIWYAPVAAALSMCFISMAGFVLNDVYDLDKDRAEGRVRPISSGDLPISAANMSAGLLLLVGVSIAFGALGFNAGLCAALTAVGVALYSPVATALPLIKGMYTAGLAMSPLLMGMSAGSNTMPIAAFLVLFGFVVFRECALDGVDSRGDHAVGMRTISYYIGPNGSYLLGFAGMQLALLFGVIALEPLVTKFVLLTCFVFQIGLFFLLDNERRRALILTRFTFLGGVVIMLSYA